MPLCSRGLGIGADREPDVVGVLGEAGEHLLAVDDVVVAVAHGARPQRRQVGPGARLAVADREVQLAAQDGAGEASPSARRCRTSSASGPTVHSVRNGIGNPARWTSSKKMYCSMAERALAAELLRPADAEPAVRAHPAQRLRVERPAPFGARRPRRGARRSRPRRSRRAARATRALSASRVVDVHRASSVLASGASGARGLGAPSGSRACRSGGARSASTTRELARDLVAGDAARGSARRSTASVTSAPGRG